MLRNLIDAYETKLKGKDTFFKKIKKQNIVTKILGAIYLLAFILSIVSVFNYSTKFFCVCVILLLLIPIICLFISLREYEKKWKSNIENYNELLDELRDILKLSEFNLYSKNKIKQLIRKLQKSINEREVELEKGFQSRHLFMSSYIFPIFAFCMGRFGNEISVTELVAIGIIAVIFILWARLIIQGLNEIWDCICGNPLEKRKNLLSKLQDLLDRDFEIEDNDILEL